MRGSEVKSSVLGGRASQKAFRYAVDVVRFGALIVLGLGACAPAVPRSVPRVVDGHVEQGPVISPYAYEWFLRGELASAIGEHDDAAIAFENAVAAPTVDVVVMSRLAEEYELSGASRRADRALALARRAFPGSARVELAQGRILQSRGDEEGAIDSFVLARRAAPGAPEPVIALSKALHATGHRHRAYATLLDYVATTPREHARAALDLLIAMSTAAGDSQTLREALALDTRVSPEERAHEAGALALHEGQPALAARILAGFANTPTNAELWIRALVERGDRQSARDFVRSNEGKVLGGTLDRARVLADMGHAESVLSLLRAAGASAESRYLRGRALWMRGDSVRAAEALADVPLGAADFELARLFFADCTMNRDRPGAALETLHEVPHDSHAVREKQAEAYLEAGALRHALRLFDPKENLDRASLARLYERAGRFTEAAAYYATVAVPPEADPRLRARATSERLASRGQIRSAVAILEQWTALAPEDLHARARLLELLVADGRREAAIRERDRLLEVVDDAALRAYVKGLLAR